VKLYLITHAHTQQDQTQDARLWRLSPLGEPQAAALADQPFWAEVTALALSSEAKTRLTVEPLLARRPLPVTLDGRFDELHRPSWVGEAEYLARVRQTFAQPRQPAGDWEPAQQALERFLAGIAALTTQFAGETVALVGHGLTLSLYRAHLLGQGQVAYEDWQQLSFAAVALADPVAGRLLADFAPVAGASPRGG
jgi:broad specificity phosphatase PhoE